MVYPVTAQESSIHIGGYTRVFPTEIIFCEGDRNYTHVHFTHRPLLTLSITMRILHERLGANQFLRISRSTLVNYDCIAGYDKYEVTLRNGLVLPIARRRRSHVRKSLTGKYAKR